MIYGSSAHPTVSAPANQQPDSYELGSLSKLVTQDFLQYALTEAERNTPLRAEVFEDIYSVNTPPDWQPTLQHLLEHRSGLSSATGRVVALLPPGCAPIYCNENYALAAQAFERQTGKPFEESRLEFIKDFISAEGIEPAADGLPLGAGGLKANPVGLKAFFMYFCNPQRANTLTWQATHSDSAGMISAYHAGQTNRFESRFFFDAGRNEGFLFARPWQPFTPENALDAFSQTFTGLPGLIPETESTDSQLSISGEWESHLGSESLVLVDVETAGFGYNAVQIAKGLSGAKGYLIATGRNKWLYGDKPNPTPEELNRGVLLFGELRCLQWGDIKWLVWEKTGESWTQQAK